MTVTQAPLLSRDKFNYMHLMRCSVCRKEWLETLPNLMESRRSKALEKIVHANHNSVVI